MKKMTVKRVLSWMLVLCMTIGLFPVYSVAASEYDAPTGELPTHDFRKAIQCFAPGMHWSSYAQTGYTPDQVTDLAQTTAGAGNEIYPNSTAVTEPWAFVGATATYGSMYFKGGYCFDFSAGEDTYVQFKVSVDGGMYSLSTLNSVTYYSAVLDVYLAPADAADATAEEYLLGSADLSCTYANCPTNGNGVNAMNYWPYRFDFGTKALDGGEYLLTYKFKANGRNGLASRTYLTGFSFDPIKLEADIPTSLAMGKTAKVALSIPDANVEVTYTASSDDENVLTASVSNGILMLTPVSEGSAKVTVVANDGVRDIATKTVEITIISEARDFTYDFRRLVEYYTPGCGWSSWWQKGYAPNQVTDLAQTTKGDANEIYPTSSIVTDPWCFVGATATYQQIHYQYGTFFSYASEASQNVQFKIAIGQDGEFNVKTLNTVNYYAPVLNVYLAPESDTANATDAKYLLGEINPSCTWANCPSNGSGVNGGNWSPTEFDLGTHDLTAGNYILTYQFKANGINGLATRAFFAGLKLDNTYVDPMTVTLTASDIADIVVGQSGSTTLTLVDVAGDPVEFAKENVTVTVSDTNVADAAVSEDGKTVTVTGKQKGETTLTINVKLSERANDTVEIPINITGDKNAKILKAGDLKDVAVGSSRTTALYIVNGNDEVEAVDMTNAVITVADPTIASAVHYASGGTNIVVTGLAVGETTVNVTCGGLSMAIPVKVIAEYPEETARKLHYDFLKLSSRHENGQNLARQPGEVINLEQTTKGHKNEIYPRSSKTTDPWCFVDTTVSQVPSALGYPPYWFDPNNSYIYGIRMDASADQGGWARYKIDVPADGLYQAVTFCSHWYMMGITEIYLAPVSAENPMDSKYSLGSVNMYRRYDKANDAANWVVEDRFGAAMLSAGEYYLTYYIGATTSTEGGWQNFASSFELHPIDGDTTMSFTLGDSATLKAATTYQMPMSLSLSNGVSLNLNNAVIDVTSDNTAAADAEAYTDPATNQVSLKLVGNAPGTANVRVLATMNGVQIADRTVAVTVAPAGILTSISLGFEGYDNNRISTSMTPKLVYQMYDQDGDLIPQLPKSTVTYESSNESVATVAEDGAVTPLSLGETTITATVTYNNVTVTKQYDIIVTGGKTESTYYTPEKVANARYNAENYSWARSTVDAATKAADIYVGKEELLWNAVTTQELPRGAVVGYRFDPNKFTCRYCGVDLADKHGSYSWIIDPINNPFKIQCPDCRRYFPSNDFAGFYKLGINEQGNWSYELAKQKNAELVEAGEDGYLKNILYPEKGEGWGVDDGYGYRTGKTITNEKGAQEEEVHTYIAYYAHWGLWHSNGILQDALAKLINAYVYTGDAKYGRVGAILIDRIADVYPEMDVGVYFPNFFNSDSSQPAGKALGTIWECAPTKTLARAYDAFFPMMEDPQVISFLSEKAQQYDLGSSKDSAELLRLNCEDGILRAIYEGAKGGDVHGNFGMHQSSVATAAVVLDTMPETKEMIDWVMQSGGWLNESTVTGGNVLEQLLATVDRDGHGNEAAPGYNALWLSNVAILADTLAGYDGYTSADLYNNPKFIKMFTSSMPLTLAQNGTAAIGDSGRVASTKNETNAALVLKAFELTGRPEFAQVVYYLYGGKVENIHGDIFSASPEKLQQQIRDVIAEYGEYDLNKSEQVTSFGFSILRGGEKYVTADNSGGINTLQDFWIYYGGGTGHKHPDGLNLGLEAFGVNMAPDLGYPLAADGSDSYTYWSRSTLNHNTIMVNGKNHTHYNLRHGYPLHFDDSDRVKVMDISHPLATPDVSTYRRSVVMVQATDEVAYGIDFFRVVGGNDHLYSFHSQSDDVTVEGVTLVPQVDENGEYVGSYAGRDVAYGTAQSVNGYAWFKNVDKAENPGTGTFTADFKVTDFRDTVVNNEGLHLKMTMLNDFDLSEVSVTEGIPAQIEDNPEMLKFVFARRTGTNLDSLFTTVFEPYREGENYIDSIESVPVTKADGSDAGSEARAVKVTLKNGRIDYVIYASDETADYNVDGKFDFRGFVGVASLIDGDIAYQYLNDGTKFGDMTAQAELTGLVADFTRENAFENSITVSLNQNVDPSTLAGHHIYINNDAEQNAVYAIKGAKLNSSGQYVLDIGDITLIRGSKDAADLSKGYIYNIESGQTFTIPLAAVEDTAPVFDPVGKKSVEAGSELKFIVSATSPVGRELTYSAGTLPRGAQFNPETQTFSWIPDSARVGTNIAAINVTDGVFTQTQYIEIQVYNATGGTSPSAGTTTPGSMGPGSTTAPDDGKTDEENPDDSGNTGDTDDKTKRFIDLGNHKWAEDAIYRLVDLGVINGTSENTYSPGNAITRADFTTLIVRAFDFTAETTENFPDVESGKYYTDTIAIAKALGIVNGDGKGNFNPMASITRQDMMVIIARAASVAGIDLSGDVENSFPDMDKVSDYAKDAVELLISSGIIAGSNGLINPLGTTTRAEVAVVLDRLVSLS